MNALAGLANYSDDEEDNQVEEQQEVKKQNVEETRTSPKQPPPPQSPQPPKTISNKEEPLDSLKHQRQPVLAVSKEARIGDGAPAAIHQHLNATDKARRRKLLLTPKPVAGVDNWGIPAESESPCDSDRLERIAHFLSLRSSGHRLNDHLQNNKAFRNPRIYAKLVEFIDLDETGSNFPKDDFDPHGFPQEAYIDGILEQQRKHAEEKALAQQNRSSVAFVQPQQQQQQQQQQLQPQQQPSLSSLSQQKQPTQEQSAVMAAALANVAKVKSRIEQQKRSSSRERPQWDERERKRRAHRD